MFILRSFSMTRIVPITEMKDTVKMFEMSENEPVYIMKGGYCSRVLLNVEMYNGLKEILLDLELEERYRRSEVDRINEDAHMFLKRLLEGRVQSV